MNYKNAFFMVVAAALVTVSPSLTVMAKPVPQTETREQRQQREKREREQREATKKAIEEVAKTLDLEKADQLGEAWIKAETDVGQKIAAATYLARTVFSKYKVYGSKFANKYAKIIMGLQKDKPADFIRTIQWYAVYARDYALITDEEFDKMIADCYTLPGVTSQEIVSMRCFEIQGEESKTDACALAVKALDHDAKTPGERISIYQAIARVRHGDSVCPALVELLEKRAFQEDAFFTERAFTGRLREIANNYVTGCTDARYEEANKFLTGFAARAKGFVVTAKAAFEKAEKEFNSYEDGGFKTDKDKRAAGKKRDELRKIFNDAKEKLRVARESTVFLHEARVNFYTKFAKRYYDEPSPVMLKKAIAVREEILAILSPDDERGKVNQQRRIMFIAYDAKDYAHVKKMAAIILSNTDANIEKDTSFKAWANYALGFVAYDEEDYEKALAFLVPLTTRNDREFNQRLYEKIVRSYVALGNYKEALKYTDKMVEFAPRYMKDRYKQQIEELKER